MFPPGLELSVGFLACLMSCRIEVPISPPNPENPLPGLGQLRPAIGAAHPILGLSTEAVCKRVRQARQYGRLWCIPITCGALNIGLPEWQAKDRPDGEHRLDRKVGIDRFPTSFPATDFRLSRHRRVRHPDRHIAPPAKRAVIARPVGYTVLWLGRSRHRFSVHDVQRTDSVDGFARSTTISMRQSPHSFTDPRAIANFPGVPWEIF